MHDLLKEMGQDIVRCESPEEPGKRSRLWAYNDVLHVLTKNTGTDVVKGIMLNMPFEAKERLSAEAFTKMKILRFLKIGGRIQLPQGLSYLSNELRIIDWHGYPLKSMPTSFQPNKLVELRMRCSDIKQLWKGIMILNELKLIDLSDSQNLIEIPDLSEAPNLKQLFLNGCTRLSNIHPSLGDLKQLIRLDLNGCKRLKSLPHKISLEALEFFNLSGCSNLSSLPIAICSLMSLKTLNLSSCSKLDELPENLGKIKGLEVLDLSGTAITGLPSSIGHLKNLKVLSLSRCVGLSSNKLTRFPLMQRRRSPDPMGMLEGSLIGSCSLTALDIIYRNVQSIPNGLGGLSSLRDLNLMGNNFVCLPESIFQLSNLTNLDLSHCNVQTIPNVLGCLSSLERLNLSGNNFVCLPESIIQLSNLRFLLMSGCAHLRMLPKLPLNIVYVEAIKCTSLETLSLRPESDFRPHLRLLGCDKLIKNQDSGDLFSTMLRHVIIDTQGHQNEPIYCYMEIPGSEIPKWFSHQNVGGSVNLQVPSDLIRNKLMGLAVCAVFVFRKHHGDGRLEFSLNGQPIFRFSLSNEFGKIISYQLLMLYNSSTRLAFWDEKILKKSDANGFSQIEVKFESEVPGLEVMKCGAHLVSERDIEDLKLRLGRAAASSLLIMRTVLRIQKKIPKLSEAEMTLMGKGLDLVDPKRIRLPNLIERKIPRLGNWLGNSSTQEQGDSDCEEEKSQ
ncbi:disease resistance protein RPV1-like [Quercus robur]|uniref:disease resistance protein RPV1-like n=1 Tax=Quercus robur TaxID=38942 RepID=UPI00216202AC|nr:disease resistance protein RPV1-like [Quercus robur]XP_050253195.1 disease resistance protein RPV1-like [Quercus robur]XP_050253196.1 disease resistance protein RPV1-like [Quercus robur]XP_050253197.1 disease resistance protein RPV1-like [Quercus robur]XP_050253198.1 disease resistance protein RPV1-like [Quercus robur]XP_050253199.1 disease resistance protein RPV1-like [Quercus robur]